MRLSSAFLLAVLPIGLAIPLMGRSPKAYDTPTPATTSTGAEALIPVAPVAAASSAPTGVVASVVPPPESPLNGVHVVGGLLSTVLGSAGGLSSLTGAASGLADVGGVKARGLDSLPAPLLKRLEDLALDIRAEMDSRNEAVEERDSPTLGSLRLTDAQLAPLSQATGLTTTALKDTPLSSVSTLPGISNLSPANLSALTALLPAGVLSGASLPVVGKLPVRVLRRGLAGIRKNVGEDEVSDASLEVDRLIAV